MVSHGCRMCNSRSLAAIVAYRWSRNVLYCADSAAVAAAPEGTERKCRGYSYSHAGRGPSWQGKQLVGATSRTDQKGIVILGKSGGRGGCSQVFCFGDWLFCVCLFVVWGFCFFLFVCFVFKQKIHDLQQRKISEHKTILNILSTTVLTCDPDWEVSFCTFAVFTQSM